VLVEEVLFLVSHHSAVGRYGVVHRVSHGHALLSTVVWLPEFLMGMLC
jgi:hypothetical protein